MKNPLAGIDLTDPWHWPYFVAVCLTPLVVIVCLVTVLIGGWLVALIWFIFVWEIRPVEVERAMGPGSLDHLTPPQPH